MTWQDEARAAMDRALEVYITKDEAKNAQRARRKAEVIDWTVEQLERGWQPAGTTRDLPVMPWASDYWKGVREAVLIASGRRCAACGAVATEVHHIRPRHLRGHDHPCNLLPLCVDCHDEIHRRLDNAIVEAIEATVRGMTGAIQ